MRWLRRGLFAVLTLLLLFGVGPVISAQDIRAADNKKDTPLTATLQLEDVRLRGDIVALLGELALQHNIPIGFEQAMNAADFTERRMRFERITLADLLTQLIAEYKQYSWEIRDGVVYVFPKEGFRDPILERVLNVEIETFSLKKGTLTWDVEAVLFKSREVKEVVDAYGLTTRNGYISSGFYFPQLGRNFTLDASDTTVMSILNRIVKESPVAKFWSISRTSSSHSLFLDLAATHEGTPKNLRRPIEFDELELLSYPIP